jgi:quercetin dioxygenase-like cupin family protein
VPVFKASDHPQFDFGGNTITGLASPGRGTTENAMFRVELPPGGSIPRHRHDHEDLFAVIAGAGSVTIGQEESPLEMGDVVLVPTGQWHQVVAGEGGIGLLVAMLGGTRTYLEDGTDRVPPWVS